MRARPFLRRLRAHQEEVVIRVIPALTALALGGFAAPASAEDWRLATASTQAAVFVDAGSVQRSGRSATFRFWTIYRARSETGPDNAKVLRRADCDDYSFTDLERTFLQVDRVLATAGEGPLDHSQPGSLNYLAIRYACVGPERPADPNIADPYGSMREYWASKE